MLLSGKLNPATVSVPFEVAPGVELPHAVATTTKTASAEYSHPDDSLRIIESLLGAGRLPRSNPEYALILPLCGLEGGRAAPGWSPQETQASRRQLPAQKSPGEHPRAVLLRDPFDDKASKPSSRDDRGQSRGGHHLDSRRTD